MTSLQPYGCLEPEHIDSINRTHARSFVISLLDVDGLSSGLVQSSNVFANGGPNWSARACVRWVLPNCSLSASVLAYASDASIRKDCCYYHRLARRHERQWDGDGKSRSQSQGQGCFDCRKEVRLALVLPLLLPLLARFVPLNMKP